MSDDRSRPRPEADRDPDTSLTEGSVEMLETTPDDVAPMPTGPNDDGSFGTDPPVEVDMARTSDDDDLNPAGGGVSETPLLEEYAAIARRNDLARQFEDLIAGIREFAQEHDSDDAAAIADELVDVYDRFGEPPEVDDEIPDEA
jgi:hypothetical protein